MSKPEIFPQSDTITDKVRSFAYMKKLTIDLQNCHGIGALSKEFDFERVAGQEGRKNVYAIYAQNGIMKSSLARTFRDVSLGNDPEDHIFPSRPHSCSMVDESGHPINPDSILVAFSFEKENKDHEKVKPLLLDPARAEEYYQLLQAEEEAKSRLLQTIQKQTKIPKKKDLEQELSVAITFNEKRFIEALRSVQSEVESKDEPQLSEVPYENIFDPDVMATLRTPEYQAIIEDYVKLYAALLDNSVFFKKGTFEYYGAEKIAKALGDHGFFKINHSVILNPLRKKGEEPLVVKTYAELVDLINNEKESITNNEELRKKFDKLGDALDKNKTVQSLRTYFAENEHLIPRLRQIDGFRRDVWISYLKSNKDLYKELLQCYESSSKRKQEILQEAAKLTTEWHRVIEIFNTRFDVPFKLGIQNQVEVMVGADAEPRLSFEYISGSDHAAITKAKLFDVLSTGEQKAFYLLGIIFQIEVRKATGQETLFIMDDIADSFDYNNKYAIIQYLLEIADMPNFKLLILTHNFDFYRIVNGRFIVPYQNCLVAQKESGKIELKAASGIQNPFINDWKNRDKFSNGKKKIASIAFLRNLIEYFESESHPDYLKLTSLLHWKKDTMDMKVSDLDNMFFQYFKVRPTPTSPDKPVFDLIEEQALDCMTGASGGFDLEKKIVLSIAIRLNAEKYMVTKISDTAFEQSLESKHHQTQLLVTEFVRKFPGEADAIKILRNVALMTPENIHLNSFMYEPILDMSAERLRGLLSDVKALK
jgi:hypothetical protein